MFRTARLRTTSASSKMFPVFILSRLCLKRRFQFLGISVEPPECPDHHRHCALVDDLPQTHPLRVVAGRSRSCRCGESGSSGTRASRREPRASPLHDRPCAMVRIDHLVADVEQASLPDFRIGRHHEKVPTASSLPATRLMIAVFLLQQRAASAPNRNRSRGFRSQPPTSMQKSARGRPGEQRIGGYDPGTVSARRPGWR